VVARPALLLAASFVLSLGCPAPRIVPPTPTPLRPIPEPPQPKVAPLPAAPERIPHTFEPTLYTASLDIDPGAKTFTGALTVTGTLAEPTAVLWFHSKSLRVDKATATHGGQTQKLVVRYLPERELVAVQSPDDLVAGEWSITFAYEGIFNARGHSGAFRQWMGPTEYVATQFEPDFARRVFPCIDEPDRKVPWQLTINAPSALEVVGNAPVLHTTANANGTKRVELAQTKPVPSYLVAFAVGPFEIVDGGKSKSGIPIRILTLRGHSANAKHAASVTSGILDRIEDYLGVPFAYPKLDVITVPSTPNWWYAMENPGLVTIDIDALSDPPKYDRVIGHEIAHHWFGDLVTLAWWDDLWLNESFAEWVARAAEGSPPVPQAPLASVNAIVTPVRDARHAFPPGEGIRSKAPAMLSRLLGYLGAARFKQVLQTYLNSHAHGNVTSAAFIDAVRTVDADSATLAAGYIANKESVLSTELECKGKEFRINVINLSDDWGVACFTYDRDGKRAETCTRVTRAQPTITLDTKRCPTWIFGEGMTAFSVKDLMALRDAGWDQLTMRERERVAELVPYLLPDVRWSFMPKLAQLTDPNVRELVANTIWTMRDAIDDSATRDALDAWVRTQYGSLAAQTDFDTSPGLAMLLAAGGDATLIAKARAMDAAALAAGPDTTDYGYVLWSRTALARVSKKDAAALFERWLAAKPPVQYEYLVALRRSPFILELLRDNEARVRGNAEAVQLLFNLCSASADEITAVGVAIDPAQGARIVDAMLYGTCVVERRQTTAALQKFLVPKKP